MTKTANMLDIDFLPSEYRQRHANKRWGPWALLAVLAGVGMILCAATLQRQQRLQIEAEQARVVPLYDQAIAQDKRLGEVQAELRTLRSEADLYTYLRYPWPKTQLLAGVLEPLPSELFVEQLQIARDALATGSASANDARSRQDRTNPEEFAKLPLPEREVRRLREEYDKGRTVIHLSGTLADSAVLHEYLAQLGRNPLFAKAELDSIETLKAAGEAVSRFKLTIVVRPGYGQPGGRSAIARSALAQTVGTAEGDRPIFAANQVAGGRHDSFEPLGQSHQRPGNAQPKRADHE